MTIVVECYADSVLWEVVGSLWKRPISIEHLYGKGRVVNAVLRDGKWLAGMVDEDPGAISPKPLERARRVKSMAYVDLMEHDGRYAIVLKPFLESCHFTTMQRLGGSALGNSAKAIHDGLATNQIRGKIFQIFRSELEKIWNTPDSYLAEISEAANSIPGF